MLRPLRGLLHLHGNDGVVERNRHLLAMAGLLARQKRGAGNEIQLTDSMEKLSQTQPFHAHVYEGRTYDCGSKHGFIEANVAFALSRPDIGGAVYQSIRDMVMAHEGGVRAA